MAHPRSSPLPLFLQQCSSVGSQSWQVLAQVPKLAVLSSVHRPSGQVSVFLAELVEFAELVEASVEQALAASSAVVLRALLRAEEAVEQAVLSSVRQSSRQEVCPMQFSLFVRVLEVQCSSQVPRECSSVVGAPSDSAEVVAKRPEEA